MEGAAITDAPAEILLPYQQFLIFRESVGLLSRGQLYKIGRSVWRASAGRPASPDSDLSGFILSTRRTRASPHPDDFHQKTSPMPRDTVTSNDLPFHRDHGLLHPHDRAPLSKRREADFAHVQRRPPTVADTMRTGIYAVTRANIKANLFHTRRKEREYHPPSLYARTLLSSLSLSLFSAARSGTSSQHGSEIYT